MIARIARLSLLMLTATLLPGCDGSTDPQNECNSIPYTIGAEVNGSLTTDDCPSFDGEQFADFYEIITTAAGPISITLEQGSRRMGVAILDEDGVIVDLRFANPGVAVSAFGDDLPAGTYFGVVTAFNIGETGTYTMSTSTTDPAPPEPLFGCEASQPYTLGTTVTGTLTNLGCLSDAGQNFNLYDFTVASGGTITFTLEAAGQADPYIYLFDEEGNVIAFRDVGGPGADEQLTRVLSPGNYFIGASDFQYGATSGYTLRSQ
jgi:hypothetical protein